MPETMAPTYSGTGRKWYRRMATHHKLVAQSYLTKHVNILMATLNSMMAKSGYRISCSIASLRTAMRLAPLLLQFIDLPESQ